MNATETATMKVNETVPLLRVQDIEVSKRFYCEGLGFQMTQSYEPDGYHICFQNPAE